jgi:hypothetical protein
MTFDSMTRFDRQPDADDALFDALNWQPDGASTVA